MLQTCPKSCASCEDNIAVEDTEKDTKDETKKGLSPEVGIEKYILEDDQERDEDEEQEETE
jgi:hypothetical protein